MSTEQRENGLAPITTLRVLHQLTKLNGHVHKNYVFNYLTKGVLMLNLILRTCILLALHTCSLYVYTKIAVVTANQE